jgi:hypothetical protein
VDETGFGIKRGGRTFVKRKGQFDLNMNPTNRCKTCKWWVLPEESEYWGHDEIVSPRQWPQDKPLPVEFEVRYCEHPRLLFCERPAQIDAATVADGSTYMANLLTAENFGCVMHEAGKLTPEEYRSIREES